jgi:hypothetical protein
MADDGYNGSNSEDPPPGMVDTALKSKYDTYFRKTLMQRIGELGEVAHREIFHKMKRAGVDHTRNKNGVFINLSVVSDPLLEDIIKFVDYCIDSNRDLENYEKMLNACKSNNNLAAASSNATTNHDAGGENGSLLPDVEDANKYATKLAGVAVDDNPAPLHHDRGEKDEYDTEAEFEYQVDGGKENDVNLSDADVSCLLRLKASLPYEAEKNTRRRASTKYALAKKKFSKKRNIDKRSSACDVEPLNELRREDYVYPDEA